MNNNTSEMFGIAFVLHKGTREVFIEAFGFSLKGRAKAIHMCVWF